MDKPKILLLEDSQVDADLVRARLSKEGIDCELIRVDCREKFESAMRTQRFDLILADQSLPDYDGVSALQFARRNDAQTPFIFVSGQLGEELAVDCLQRGATDYVLKQRLERLGPAVRSALASRKRIATEMALHETERALRTSEERLDMVLKNSELGLWYCDLPFDKLIWNDKVKEHFGLQPHAEVDIDVFLQRIHPEDRQRTRQAIERSIAENTRYDIVYRTVMDDDAIRHIRAIGSTFYDGGNQPIRFDGITMDVTAVKEAEQERERLLKMAEAARRDAEAANRMKDQFLATLSHELRTPLNAILGWARLLRTGLVERHELDEGLDAIERNSKIQAKLIEDLLDISRIISGTLRLDVQRVNLADVIESALTSVLPAAEAKGVRLHKILDSLVAPVSGDPARLQQVVWNLLTNAVKFTSKGGQVQILLERVNSHVEISVIDTGQGIRPDFLPFVFDRFRQADSSTTRSHGGLGLGLSIVKQLVEMHGGGVRAKSPGEKQGATFTVMLPITVVQRSERSEVHEAPATECPAEEFFGRGDVIAGVKVLVVDDEPDARALVKRVLEGCGAEVRVASSVVEALEVLRKYRPQVLVSDIGMPGEDGYDLMRQVRASGLSATKVPAVALTAFARSEDRRRAMMAGFQTHVAKPVDPAELVAVVASLAGRTGGL